MDEKPRTDADERIQDAQPIKTGKLSEDEKLDIALEGSMMTSEPPQIAEPKTVDDDKHAD